MDDQSRMDDQSTYVCLHSLGLPYNVASYKIVGDKLYIGTISETKFS